jgi:hypothetical protein
MSDPINIKEAEQVTPDVLRFAEDIYEGWFSNDDQIDWEPFWDRLEKYGFAVASLDCGATRKIQRHIRKFRSEA